MDWKSGALGVVFVAMWASAFTAARLVVTDAPPFLALSVRFAISGGVALAIGWAVGQRIRLSRAQWGAVAVFGICQNALYLGLNFEGMRTVDASVAVIVAALLPLTVAGLGRVFLGERLGLIAVLGLFAGFGGVLLIMSARVGAGADAWGVALCVAGGVALAVATLLAGGAAKGGNLWMGWWGCRCSSARSRCFPRRGCWRIGASTGPGPSRGPSSTRSSSPASRRPWRGSC
jgi:drug/metabolite transporter (DMT)-like permease